MKVQSAARSWAFGIMAFLAIIVGIYALAMYAIPSHIQEAPLVKGKGELPTLWYPVLWAHAISSGLAITIGWLQFIKRLRAQKPNLHRAIGYVYACLIAIGGITGLYLSWYADGGWLAATGFGVLSTLWMYTVSRDSPHCCRSRLSRTWPLDDSQLCAYMCGNYTAPVYAAGSDTLRAFRFQ